MRKRRDLTGVKYSKLTGIHPVSGTYYKNKETVRWLWQCDCGNKKEINTTSVIRGLTTSCGCVNVANARKKVVLLKKINNRNSYQDVGLYDTFKKIYCDGNLEFKDFQSLCQKECYYCKSLPSNKLKYIRDKKINYYFYNGLDRVDNTKKHDKNNVIPCCKFCNQAKRNLTLLYFINHIISMYNYRKTHYDELYSKLKFNIPKSSFLVFDIKNKKEKYDFNVGSRIGKLLIIQILNGKSRKKFLCECDCGIKKRFSLSDLTRGHSRSCATNKICKRKLSSEHAALKPMFNKLYNDDNLTYENFYTLSQMNCVYCGVKGSNIAMDYWTKNKFSYNGLDRITTSKKHSADNVVPCCRHCNFMKSTMEMDEFDNWLNSIYNEFIVLKKGIIRNNYF